MRPSLVSLAAFIGSALSIPHPPTVLQPRQPVQPPCENTPSSRHCWGDFSTSTNYYTTAPSTNVTREYHLSVLSTPCAPNGYNRTCMTFNGTIPGPTLHADWGDNLIVHVTNHLPDNGTSIHWHGLHMRDNVLNDGVPGVTQCGIAPGETMTYRFRVTQYGSTWYHSHFSLQYSEGLFGGVVVRGPATGDYDEDLGMLFLQDWGRREAFELWSASVSRVGKPPVLEGGLVNGTNRGGCEEGEEGCVGEGKKFEMVFERGKRYLIRVVNVAIDGVFQFSIDGHNLTVVAHDLVPIVPYTTDSVQLTVGQRYDVVVEADAAPGDYWLRGGWLNNCASNHNAADITGIVRYDKGSTADPESVSSVTPSTSCLGELVEKGVPYFELDVTNMRGDVMREELGVDSEFGEYFRWTINTSSLVLNWSDPTMQQIFNGEPLFPTEYNVVPVNASGTDPEWVVLVIQDTSNIAVAHPFHLHGHDFWILAEDTGVFDGNTTRFKTVNPSRRDTATLPGNGYLAIAFLLDNPGAWLAHCHIAWHASQGLSLEFVESKGAIQVAQRDRDVFDQVCEKWREWKPVWEQDDSGI